MNPRLLVPLLGLVLLASCSSDDADPVRTPSGPEPAPVTDLLVISGAVGSLTLTWTSPRLPDGGDGAIGYELRHCAPGEEDGPFTAWTRVATPANDPEPGLAHEHTVEGLTADHTYLFRLRARVGQGGWSDVSNTVIATAATEHDQTRPAPVGELRQWAGTAESLTVAWAAAGDDSIYGAAAAYEVRWHAAASTWTDMTPATGPVTPASKPGWWQTTIEGASEGDSYNVRVRATDDAGHLSAPSTAAVMRADTMRVWYVNVDGTGDKPTIEAAVDSAGMGDLILVGPGRYTWTNQGTGDPQFGIVWVKQNNVGWELRGEEGPEATIIDGEGMGPVIHIAGALFGPSDETPTWPGIVIDGFTLTGGVATGPPNVAGVAYAGGGLVFHLSNAVIRNCIITDNEASQGGGIWYGGQGVPVIENCEIYGNRAISNPEYPFESGFGGGMLLVNNKFGVTVRDCIIRDNEADRYGGGVLVAAAADEDKHTLLLTMTNVAVYGNEAEAGGGLWLNRLGAGSEIRDCLITGNIAPSQGGGIYWEDVTREHRLVNCTIAGNQAGLGSAMRVKTRSMAVLENCIVADNSGGSAFSVQSASGITASCTVVHGHREGDHWPRLFVDGGGNFNLDPGFCNTDDYTLRADSPCLPGLHPDGADCGLIGAQGEGCR